MEGEHFDYENGKQTSSRLYPSLTQENSESSQRCGSFGINNDLGRMRLSSNAFSDNAFQNRDKSLSSKSLDLNGTGMSFEIIPDDMSEEYNERREESPAMFSGSIINLATSQRSTKTEETDVSTDEEFSDSNNRSTPISNRLISTKSASLENSHRSSPLRSFRGRGRGRLVLKSDKKLSPEIPQPPKKTNIGATLVLRPGQCQAKPLKAPEPEQFSDADEEQKTQQASFPVPPRRAFVHNSPGNELCGDPTSENGLSENESTNNEVSDDERSCKDQVIENMQDENHTEKNRYLEMEETIKLLQDELQSCKSQHSLKETDQEDTIKSLRMQLEQSQTKNAALVNRNKQFQQEHVRPYLHKLCNIIKISKKDEDVTQYETEMKEYIESLKDEKASLSKKFQRRIEELESEVGQWRKARANANQQVLYFLRSAAESQSKLDEERNKMKEDLEWKQSECHAMQLQLQQINTKLEEQQTEIRRLYQYKDLAENQKLQLLNQSVRRIDMEKILNDEKVKAQKQKEEYERNQSRLDELEEDNNCKICFDPFNDTDHFQIALKCGHKFGNTCIKSSFARRKNCPTCNQPASEGDFRRLYNN
ncbi:unnamed protein product [Oikopleura dioica]|uniref:RING-type domain-containing protein n=1 Tax=Oikopleura dioica TaxID=34765 RepID=E4X096_OIKDI|nr:unnamed protein product [Oikopleura dioica]